MTVDELINECRKLPNEIAPAAEAIVRYISSVADGNWVEGDSGRWRIQGANFVTVKSQYARAGTLAITVRGNPHEFEVLDGLELKTDQNGYSRFAFGDPRHTVDAIACVRRAKTLFDRGGQRPQTTPRTLG